MFNFLQNNEGIQALHKAQTSINNAATNDRNLKRSKVTLIEIIIFQIYLQIREYDKKIFEVESQYDIEKQKNDFLMKEVQRLLGENADLENGVDSLKRENLDFLEYMNSILLTKHQIN